MEKQGIVVIFPGRNYSCDKPLLYYGETIFRDRGYEVFKLGYNYKLKGDKDDILGLIEEAKKYALEELLNIDFSKYKDIIFLSKSMGTALAGYFEQLFQIRARHIFLTPVAESLVYLKRGKGLVVAGKEDKILDARKLKIYCVEQDIPLKQFEEVGHRLEHEDINKTFAILMVIIKMYMNF